MGYRPDWYENFVVADRCKCKPWEVTAIPDFWRRKALVAQAAESQARKQLEERAMQKGKRKR
jgi:hypothetical protein